jgi:hypothetical protein
MKKRLLLSLALMLGLSTTSLFAYNVGDYMYTPTAKLKVTGTNLLKNGDFSAQTTSWTGKDGAAAVSATYWSVQEGVGPNGENVLQSLDGGAGEDNYIYQSVAISAGNTYVVSFQIKGTNGSVSTVTNTTDANYVDAFVNADGSVSKDGARQIFDASNNVITAQWSTISDTIVANTDGYVVIGVGRLEAGTQVTGFSVQTASKVYDTRIAQARVDYDKRILALTEFPQGKDDLQGMVDQIDAGLKANDMSALGTDIEDESAMSDLINGLSSLERTYLDANSFDLVNGKLDDEGNVVTAAVIDKGNLWTQKIQKGEGQFGDWFVTGGRWFHNKGDAEVRDDFPGSYSLPANTIEIQKALPAGKYFFQIEVKGNTNTGKKVNNSWYDIDYNTPVTNRLYIGTDTLAADTLSAREFKTYFIIADVAAGEKADTRNLIAGCQHSAQPKGGDFYYRNPVLRLISATAAEDITKFDQDNKKAVQLTAAKTMIDSANVVVEKTAYPWGKAILRTAIAKEQKLYDALEATASTETLAVLDSLGQPVVDENGVAQTKTVADSLTEVMRDMRSAIQAYYGENKPVTDLVAQTAVAQAQLDDPANAKATASYKAALQNELDLANALIKTFMAQTDSLEGDADKANAQILALQKATENFTASTASYANPSEIEIANPLMTSGPSTGWTTTGSQTDNGRWKKGANSAFEGGNAWIVSRGYTAYSKNNAKQKVTLTHAGAYEIVTQFYGYNRNAGRDGDVTTDHHNYFFAKLDASADSIAAISVHTNRGNVLGDWDQRPIDTLGYGGQTPEFFVITYNKTDDEPVEIEFGIDAMQNSGSNLYGFGGNHVRFYGDYAQYTADVKSALQKAMDEAQKALDAKSFAADSVEFKALKNAVLAGQSAIDGTTLAYPISSTVKAPFLQTYVGWVAPETTSAAKARVATNTASDEKAALESKALLQLQRAKAAFDAKNFSQPTGINEISVDDEKAGSNVKGVYNIAGQKIAEKAKNLPTGLYIVNGKKIVVR